jgi:glycosyltransferase involved in cell wall biosynthesis
MLNGTNIVCLAKDWAEDPTSNTHVMRVLARQNNVLWLNSIATRAPSLTSGRDLARCGRKLATLLSGPTKVEERLWVKTPLVLPFPHSRAATLLNRQLLRQSIGQPRRQPGLADFQLWSFIPTAANYAGRLGESLLVYYCTDEWSRFSQLDGPKIAALERRLCERADLVFTTSRALLARKRAWNPETHLASHGVDQVHFARALAADTTVPPALAGVRGPILGFFGLLEDWIDLDLFAFLAAQRPDWTIAVIGKARVDVSRLRRYPNVKLLGHQPYAELPSFCKAFSVGLLPFVVNDLTRYVNPIKLREYLAAGLPVVSSAIPEASAYPRSCAATRSPAEFLAACEAALRNDSPAARAARSAAMRSETWERQVELVSVQVERAVQRRAKRALWPPGVT